MNLDDYITAFIDGYLAADIRSMINTDVDATGKGAVGYPLVVTVSSGIEALGRISFPLTKGGRSRAADKDMSETAFLHFWNQMSAGKQYQDKGSAFYKQVRSGIIHYYLAGGNVHLYKNDPSFHM